MFVHMASSLFSVARHTIIAHTHTRRPMLMDKNGCAQSVCSYFADASLLTCMCIHVRTHLHVDLFVHRLPKSRASLRQNSLTGLGWECRKFACSPIHVNPPQRLRDWLAEPVIRPGAGGQALDSLRRAQLGPGLSHLISRAVW